MAKHRNTIRGNSGWSSQVYINQRTGELEHQTKSPKEKRTAQRRRKTKLAKASKRANR